MRIEQVILKNLIHNREFASKVLPFIKPEYFNGNGEKVLLVEIILFIEKYRNMPSIEALSISLNEKKGLHDETLKDALKILYCDYDENTDLKWLFDSTEKFCQDAAIFNAIKDSMDILDGTNKNLDRGSIPELLSNALAVSFDSHIGHDYLANSDDRYETYHENIKNIPFDIDILNLITRGGFREKTLNVFLAGPKVGKSLVMCHIASSYLLKGKNVLYITMEMAEERIAERIDANLLNLSVADVSAISKEEFQKRIDRLQERTTGKLIIKEYPTGTASVSHFRALLNDLKLKKSFTPDAIFIDYLNICASSRLKLGGAVNAYLYVKNIAEELRGLAVELKVPIISATQMNRCLDINTKVIEKIKGEITLKELQVNDSILSYNGYVNVNEIYPIEIQKVYKITTKTLKEIVCSSKHIFPTSKGMESIDNSLTVGDDLYIYDSESNMKMDTIISIEEYGKVETLDINVSGNNLFFANGILTHNSGATSSDPGMENVSESYGTAATVDFMAAIISNEELAKLNQFVFIQLASRYGDVNYFKRFTVGVDKSKMRLYNCEESGQSNLIDSGQPARPGTVSKYNQLKV